MRFNLKLYSLILFKILQLFNFFSFECHANEHLYSNQSIYTHEFIGGLVYSQQEWRLNNWGELEDVSAFGTAVGSKFTYLFHIPVLSFSDIIMGSSVSLSQSAFSKKNEGMKLNWAWSLPGFLLGASFHWLHKNQLSFGTNLSMDYLSIERKTLLATYKLISILEPSQSFFIAYSYFFSNKEFALSFESHWRKAYSFIPEGASNLLEKAKISIKEHSLAISVAFGLS